MNRLKLASLFIFTILFISVGCNKQKNNELQEYYDCSPKEFKTEQPDEWVVVNNAIDIQKNDDTINFRKIDKLVREYISKQNINLPADSVSQIVTIENICKSKFDTFGYDMSEMGMHVADGINRLFAMYINWLYHNEADKVLRKTKIVDLEKELTLYGNLYDAAYNVCDFVALCMSGSGRWCAISHLHFLTLNFNKQMCLAIIHSQTEITKELVVSLDMFDEECQKLIEFYDAEKMSHIVNHFKNVFHTRYAHRQSVASKLTDPKFKRAYESITYGNARTLLIYIKNRFVSMRMMSNSEYETCIDDDCSNQELLEFSYEKRWKEVVSDI